MKRGYILKLLALGVLVLVSLGTLNAQEVTGTIVGQVGDASGRALPNAKITITNQQTAVVRSATVSSDGAYTVPSLPIGVYTVEAQADGFAPRAVKDVSVNLGSSSRVDLKLEVGSVAETVTVTVAAPTVDTTSTSVGQVMQDTDIKNVPLNARDLQQLASIQPGVTFNNSTSSTRTLNIAGSRPEQTRYLQEGLDTTFTTTQPPQDSAGVILGIEAIREFNIYVGEPPAQYGGSGGIINTIFKSGSNSFHGSAYEYYRNSIFDSRNYFDPITGAPPFHRNQFGGAFGGPIRKDKTFFFVNYEALYQDLNQSLIGTFPDAQARTGMLPCSVLANGYAGCGANNGVSPSLYVPLTSAAAPSNCATVYGSTCNYVTEIQKIFFQPTNPLMPTCTTEVMTTVNGTGAPSGLCQATENSDQTASDNFAVVKIDHTFSAKNNISATYNYDKSTSLQPGPNPNFADDTSYRKQIFTAQDTQIFTTNLINTVRIGVNRSYNNIANDILGTVTDNNLFTDPNPVIAPNPKPQAPSITVTGMTIVTAAPSGRASSSPKTFGYTMGDVEDDINFVHGKHTLQFGGEFKRWQDNTYVANAPGKGGAISLQSEYNFLTGQAASSFQYLVSPYQSTGVTPPAGVSSLAPDFGATPSFGRSYRTNYSALYVDDTFRVIPRLTLTLGVRWEYQPAPSEAHGKLATLYSPTPETALTWQSTKTLYNASRHNFEPRVGFNWDVRGNGKSSFRGGGGIFHTEISANDWNVYGATWPGYTYNLLPTGIQYPFSLASLMNYASNPANISPLTGAPVMEYQGTLPLNPPTPTKFGYNLAFQQELPHNLAFLIGYVGTQGRHIGRPINWEDYYPIIQGSGGTTGCQPNQTVCGCPPSGPSCLFWPAPANQTVAQANSIAKGSCPVNPVPVTNPTGPCAAGVNSNTAFNQILGTVYDSNSAYNALQFTLQNTRTTSLTWRINYTHASCMAEASSDSPSSQNGGTYPYYTRNPHTGYGRCPYNAEDVVTGLVHYDLPFGHMVTSRPAKAFVGGWVLSGFTSESTGTPFEIQDGVNISRSEPSGGGNDRPNIVAGCTRANAVNHHKPGSYVNTNCFAPATPGYLGNLGPEALTGPSFLDTDLGLKRTIPIKEMKLQLGADMFNAFNRANFGVPVLNGGGGVAFTNAGTAAAPSIQKSPTFGQIVQTVTPSRQWQFSARVEF
jgi:hypothetical protein